MLLLNECNNERSIWTQPMQMNSLVLVVNVTYMGKRERIGQSQPIRPRTGHASADQGTDKAGHIWMARLFAEA